MTTRTKLASILFAAAASLAAASSVQAGGHCGRSYYYSGNYCGNYTYAAPTYYYSNAYCPQPVVVYPSAYRTCPQPYYGGFTVQSGVHHSKGHNFRSRSFRRR